MGAPGGKLLGAGDATVRNIVHLSLGGPQIRIIVSNEFGKEPITVGAASVALTAPKGDIQPASAMPVLFAGQPTVTLAPGAMIKSDAVKISVAPMSDLTVSLYLPAQTITTVTEHIATFSTQYTAPGNQVTAASLKGATDDKPWPFVKGVDILGSSKDAAIVCIGDSITDGATSTPDTNHRWPNFLAARLQDSGKFDHLGVLDEGIGGNRILHLGFGPALINRWNRDALEQDGVKYIILLESINDIGRTAKPVKDDDKITADQLIAAMTQLIDQAHAKGIKVIGATLTPYEGAAYASPEGQAMRAQVNAFIQTGGKFDGVIDFAKAVADPKHPLQFRDGFNNVDHLHPNDAGYKAMADSIDLSLFK